MKTYSTEQIRYFLEQVHDEMTEAVKTRFSWPLNLIDVVMPPGPQCEAAKEQLFLLMDRMYHASIVEVLAHRGREFLGVEIVPKRTEETEDEDEKNAPKTPIGFYG